MSGPNKIILTTREVAEWLGVSPRTITRWWQTGDHSFPSPDLPGNGGRYHRWNRSSIVKWLDRRGGKPK